ncbi:ATP synthase subunit I [Paenibacillus harenae]|uniref:ATP synthase protein I n=1 Tax=Paenibacillus harenae TaxID=306543 RepID=A0ABT9U1R8_PAEHA|nr:ATP synthase subunit I [Paenibacillus harenae]MDQ0061961.1 ATP synthase protein I [Paenibacillus harenae]MDQ0113584.1 ATP synthase protein I [Paenibacillus harenae]
MDNIMKTAVRVLLYLLAACLLVWALAPEWRIVTLGLLLGLAASSMNAFLLRRRVEMVTHGAAGTGPRKMGLGLGSRIATVLLVAMIAYRFPEKFSMPAALIGCMVMPFILLAAAYFHNKRQS